MTIPDVRRFPEAKNWLMAFALILLFLSPGSKFVQIMWSDEFDSDLVPDTNLRSTDSGVTGRSNQKLEEHTDYL